MRTLHTVVVAALLALVASYSGSAAARPTGIKLVVVAPTSTPWDKTMQQFRADVQKKTAGRVRVDLIRPGTLTEGGIVDKMGLGGCGGSLLSAIGLARVDDAFAVLGIPLFYESYEELFYVRDQLTPELAKRAEARNLVLVNWGLGGWVHVFSRDPVRTVSDLKAQKLFTSDDSRWVDWYKNNGFKPVPLAANEMAAHLQTKLIDAVPTTPLVAVYMQYYDHVPHMMDLPLAPFVGATLVTRTIWKQLTKADRQAIMDAGLAAQNSMDEELPKQDQKSVEEMKKKGLTVTTTDEQEWRKTANEFLETAGGKIVPADILELAVEARDQYRRAHGDRK